MWQTLQQSVSSCVPTRLLTDTHRDSPALAVALPQLQEHLEQTAGLRALTRGHKSPYPVCSSVWMVGIPSLGGMQTHAQAAALWET